MEIGSTLTSTAATNVSTETTAEISSDFETFLRMLTVQMQNQDPLNPVDSSDYAVQLATFSQVEQAVLTNDLLSSLATQITGSGLAEMADWVGKEARASAPAYFDGDPITISPNPTTFADKAEVVVTNSYGTEVDRFDIAVTSNPVEWAGVDTGGYPFALGLYSFEVVSLAADGSVLDQEQIETYSAVTEVRIDDGQTILVLGSGAEVSSDQVTAIRDPNL